MTDKTRAKAKVLSLPERNAYRRLEDVVGCKWSAAVLAAIGTALVVVATLLMRRSLLAGR